MQAATSVAEETPSVSLLSFAIDGVSVESHGVVLTICMFMDDLSKHTGAVANKHNAKNDRYVEVGGSSAPAIGELVADTDMLRQVGIPKELWRIKDFVSNKKVQNLES